MIVTGNYNDGEKKEGPLRKSIIYIDIFKHSIFAEKYQIFPLKETTYMMLSKADIPTFYKHCQLYSKYGGERALVEEPH